MAQIRDRVTEEQLVEALESLVKCPAMPDDCALVSQQVAGDWRLKQGRLVRRYIEQLKHPKDGSIRKHSYKFWKPGAADRDQEVTAEVKELVRKSRIALKNWGVIRVYE